MNIWASDKHFRIKHLMLLLAHEFQPGALQVKDNDEVDPRAIRLCNPPQTPVNVYIYTYGQDTDRYGAHIEYPELSDTEISNTVDIYDNISYEKLADLIQTYLELERSGLTPHLHTYQMDTTS